MNKSLARGWGLIGVRVMSTITMVARALTDESSCLDRSERFHCNDPHLSIPSAGGRRIRITVT